MCLFYFYDILNYQTKGVATMNHKLDLKLFENIMNIPSPTGYTHKEIDYIQSLDDREVF